MFLPWCEEIVSVKCVEKVETDGAAVEHDDVTVRQSWNLSIWVEGKKFFWFVCSESVWIKLNKVKVGNLVAVSVLELIEHEQRPAGPKPRNMVKGQRHGSLR